MLGIEAQAFVKSNCPYHHGVARMHVCPRCQKMLGELGVLLKSTEMELAKVVMKAWHEMTDQPQERPDYVKIADELTAYPGDYTYVTLIPGWLYRILCKVVLWGGCIALAYVVFR